MQKVTRIYHSGFCVELDETVLLFDYFEGEIPSFPNDKKLMVFVSHGHADHYSPKIFELEKQYENVSYVLYHKVSKHKQENILPVKAHETYQWNGVEIQTLLSTDEGCAFLVKAEGKEIYHAGDLNWWYWEDEPEEDNKWQEGTFKKEIQALKGHHLDCAFLTLDPRQEKNAWWGFLEVLKLCEIDYVFPMHYDCWGTKEQIEEYFKLPQLVPYREKCHLEREIIFL